MDTEIWKDCCGNLAYRYEVSNTGKLRNKETGRILISWQNTRLQRALLRTTEGYTHVSMRRLVAEAFIPNPDNYKFVKYKDGNPLNMNVDNLYWSKCAAQISEKTRERMNRCTSKRLLAAVGADAMASKPIICVETSTVYFTTTDAADANGVTHQAIQYVLDKPHRTAAGYHWKHINIYMKGE